jgi:hypothetical protein
MAIMCQNDLIRSHLAGHSWRIDPCDTEFDMQAANDSLCPSEKGIPRAWGFSDPSPERFRGSPETQEDIDHSNTQLQAVSFNEPKHAWYH